MTTRKRTTVTVAALGVAGGLGYAIRAVASGIPTTNALTYAGVLEDAAGPITGSHNIQVVVYDAPTAGNNLCQSTTAAVNVVDGHFTVQLPDACTAAVGANASTWIDILVDGSDTGRTPVGAVPYAVEAKHTPNADNATNATNAVSATNATTAVTATNASNATGALGTTISTLQSSVQAIKASPLTAAMFAASATCSLSGSTSYDCQCPAGTIAVSGGGWCGTNDLVESANKVVGTGRDLTTWRISCSAAPPANYYALCVNAL